MQKHFEILFLEEAFAFLSSLERKHYEKILYNIRKSQVEIDSELLKNSQTIFGSFEHFIKVINTGSLHFGTKLQDWRPWLSLLMDLLKKEAKYPKTKLRKQFALGQNI